MHILGRSSALARRISLPLRAAVVLALTGGLLTAIAPAAPAATVAAAPVRTAALAMAGTGNSGPTRTYNDSSQCGVYLVPSNVHQLDVTLVGGKGAAGSGPDSPGGRGGRVTGRVEVEPGTYVWVVVGSNAANNLGGPAYHGGGGGVGLFGVSSLPWNYGSTSYGGGGGSASFISSNKEHCGNIGSSVNGPSVLAVAGGGGGGGPYVSAHGGYGGDAGQAGGGGRYCPWEPWESCSDKDNGGQPGSASGPGAPGGASTPAGAGSWGGALTDAPQHNPDGYFGYQYIVGASPWQGEGWGGTGGGGWYGGGQGSNILASYGGGGGGSNYVRPAATAPGSTPSLGVETGGAAPFVTITPVDSRRLTVSRAGTGAGSVTSDVAGIDCGSTCRATYDLNANVTLTANPADGSRFVKWDGIDGCSTEPTCVVAMSQIRTVSATFNRQRIVTWTVNSAGAGGGGTVTTSPAGFPCGPGCVKFDTGTQVTLTENPNSASAFRGWDNGGGPFGCNALTMTKTCTFAVTDRDIHHYVSFAANVLTVAKIGTGTGTVTGSIEGVPCATDCSGQVVPWNGEVLLRFEADEHSTGSFSSYPCTDAETNECYFRLTGSRRMAVSFTQDSRTLDVHKDDTTPGFITTDIDGLECGLGCYDTQWRLDEGTEITLSAEGQSGTADQDSVFTGWGGACAGTGDCVVTLDNEDTVYATFAYVARHTLRVRDLLGNGVGTVSGTGGIDCPAVDCQQDFYTGTTVTLTADPGLNSVFERWGGACSGTSPTCTVLVDRQRLVDATFSLEKRTLTLERSGAGNGRLDVDYERGGEFPETLRLNCGTICVGELSYGSVVTVEAKPAANAVVEWTGACAGNEDLTCPVTLDQARTVGAVFTRNTRHLTVAVDGNGSGVVFGGGPGQVGASIDCPGTNCEADFDKDSDVELTAHPHEADSRFTGWTGPCAGQGDVCTVRMSQARSTTATFALNRLQVARAGGGSGRVTDDRGQIDCGTTCVGTYPTDTYVTLTSHPTAGSTFTGWTGPGATICGTDPQCTVKVPQSSLVTATFTTTPHVSVEIDGDWADHGSVITTSSLPGQGIECGSRDDVCDTEWPLNYPITLQAIPDSGESSGFVEWGGACSGSAPTCTFTPDDAVEVTATFTHLTNSLDVAFSGAGTGRVTGSRGGLDCRPSDADCSLTLGVDDSITLTAHPDANSEFTGWSGACAGASTCFVPNLAAARSVTAQFDLKPHHTVTVVNVGQGHGTITMDGSDFSCAEGDTCSVDLMEGTEPWFTATAGAHSTFTSWGARSDCHALTGANGSRCRLLVDEDQFLDPSFALDTRTLTVVGNPAGMTGTGKVVSDPAGIDCLGCFASFERGTRVVLRAVPAADSDFPGWPSSLCDNESADLTEYCVIEDFTGGSVTATFTHKQIRLNVNARGGRGTGKVSVSGITGTPVVCTSICPIGVPYDHPAQLILTATADSRDAVRVLVGVPGHGEHEPQDLHDPGPPYRRRLGDRGLRATLEGPHRAFAGRVRSHRRCRHGHRCGRHDRVLGPQRLHEVGGSGQHRDADRRPGAAQHLRRLDDGLGRQRLSGPGLLCGDRRQQQDRVRRLPGRPDRLHPVEAGFRWRLPSDRDGWRDLRRGRLRDQPELGQHLQPARQPRGRQPLRRLERGLQRDRPGLRDQGRRGPAGDRDVRPRRQDPHG